MAVVPRQHRSSVILGVALAVAAMWAWERYDQHRQEQADRASAEHVEQMRVNEIVRRREADSKDLLAEVRHKLDAGEDREAVKAWAEQRQREIQAEAQREIEGRYELPNPPVHPLLLAGAAFSLPWSAR